MLRVVFEIVMIAEEGVVLRVPPSWLILMVESRFTGQVGTYITLLMVYAVP